jgi:hypothetical protein
MKIFISALAYVANYQKVRVQVVGPGHVFSQFLLLKKQMPTLHFVSLNVLINTLVFRRHQFQFVTIPGMLA